MMKSQQILVVVEGGFMETALKHILNNYAPAVPYTFRSSIEDCLNGKTCPPYIIADSKLLPTPMSFGLEKIRKKNPNVNILLIESGVIDGSARCYATEILNKADSPELVNQKLKKYLGKAVNSETGNFDKTLSEREKDIVRLVAMGNTNKEISEKLFISPHTVITHRKNISGKLGIKTIAGITVYAILNELIDKDEL